MALHFFHLVASDLCYPELLVILHFQITGWYVCCIIQLCSACIEHCLHNKITLITVPSSSLSILRTPHTSVYICELVVIDRAPVMSGHISHFCSTFS